MCRQDRTILLCICLVRRSKTRPLAEVNALRTTVTTLCDTGSKCPSILLHSLSLQRISAAATAHDKLTFSKCAVRVHDGAVVCVCVCLSASVCLCVCICVCVCVCVSLSLYFSGSPCLYLCLYVYLSPGLSVPECLLVCLHPCLAPVSAASF